MFVLVLPWCSDPDILGEYQLFFGVYFLCSSFSYSSLSQCHVKLILLSYMHITISTVKKMKKYQKCCKKRKVYIFS